MKALIKSRREPGIWLGELPKPEPGPNDVLIRMRKTAICGTDIHIWQWDDWASRTIPVPMQIGHEYCGEIVALGSEVRGLAVGDRGSGEGHITCGHCRNCRAGRRHLCRNTQGVGVNRPGCFAEFMVLPAANVFRLPAGITDGQSVRLRAQGLSAGGPPGDAIVTIHVQPHPDLKPDGSDLRADITVPLEDAVLGGTARVPTLSGAVDLKIPPQTSGGRVFRLKGKGLPKKDGGHGDLLASVNIKLGDADPELEALMKKRREKK